MSKDSGQPPPLPRTAYRSGAPVSLVIPAYNEASTIGRVLDALLPVAQLSQILVVDDGSSDNTDDVVRSHCAVDPRIRLIPLAQNHGKAQAMLTGATHAHNDLIVFLDADLIGLRPQHIQALVRPVAMGECEMSIALFAGGRTATDLSHRLTPFLSGQRCLRWSRFAGTPGFAEAGWSIEVGLSMYARRQGYGVQWVEWPAVTHRMRPEKRPVLSGYWSHMRMWADIGRYILAQTGTLLADKTLHPSQVQRAMHSRQTYLPTATPGRGEKASAPIH